MESSSKDMDIKKQFLLLQKKVDIISWKFKNIFVTGNKQMVASKLLAFILNLV